MIKIAIAGALMLLASPALAQSQNAAQSLAGSQSSVNIGGGSSRSQAPSIGGVGLTTSNDTCAGSFGFGGSVAGFGLVAGSTYVIEDCNARADATLMYQMGLQEGARQRLAQRPKIRAAIAAANQVTVGERRQAIAAQRPPRGNVVKKRIRDIPSGAKFYDHADGKWKIKR